MASSAAIVHQILHTEATLGQRPASLDTVQEQTRILRAILLVAQGMESAWSRVARRRKS